jgi:hypothetical protein
MRITTVSSGRTTTQALISGAASAALASPAKGMWNPNERAPAASGRAAEKAAAGDFERDRHQNSPAVQPAVAGSLPPPAARWMAARTRL